MPVIMYILIAGILGCFLAMIVVAVRGREEKPLSDLEPVSPLNKKELSMYEDLGKVSQKHGLLVLTKAPLSLVVQPREEGQRHQVRTRLQAEVIPFLLAETKTVKPVIAILPAEFRSPLAIEALDAARLPYIQLNNYNLPGLEKAIKDKLGITGQGSRVRGGRGSARQQEEPEPVREPEPAQEQAE